MASRALLRPLLRASRPSLSPVHIACLATQATAPAAPAAAPPAANTTTATTAAPTPAPAKKPTARPTPVKPAVPSRSRPGPPPKYARPTPPETPDVMSLPEDVVPESSYSHSAASEIVSSHPLPPDTAPLGIDWTRSYHGLSEAPFSKEIADVLSQPLDPDDVEAKPDGIIYLPEIKYRRILNKAFGPGGWGLVPRSEVNVGNRIVTRDYALVCHGRFVSQAQGENTYFSLEGLPAAIEGCKSNALMRCCKDLGIASELWDPVFIRDFRAKHVEQIWVEHVVSKKKQMLWKKRSVPLGYPYKRA